MQVDNLFVTGACLLLSSTAMADVTLVGRGATPEMIVRVANGEVVTVDNDSLDRVARA